jgi:hypothetical protein
LRNHAGGPFLPAKLAPFFAATDMVEAAGNGGDYLNTELRAINWLIGRIGRRIPRAANLSRLAFFDSSLGGQPN